MKKMTLNGNLRFCILIGLLVGALAVFVSAEEPTQQFNKLRLDPLYREQLIDGDDYNYTLIVAAPDGFSEVESAIITFQVWHNPSIRYFLWVNGNTCNTESFYVSTSYANAGEGTIYFDCSDEITKEGTYTITLQTNDDTGTVTAWADITYTNKPRAEMEVFGTEYTVADPVTVWLQLLDSDGEAQNNASCFSTVWYPDKTPWFTRSIMSYQPGSNGIYYLDATAQSQIGVYMVDAVCQYTTVDLEYNATIVDIVNATYVSGTNSSVSFSDDDRYVVDESGLPANDDYEVLLHMHMDETSGTSAADSSAYNVPGTYYNSPDLTVTGTINTGTGFDGVNDYVRLDSIPSGWDVASDEDLALCFGFNGSDDFRNTERLFDFRGATGFSIIGDDDEILWVVDRSVDGGEDIKTSTHFDDNAWHNICFFTDITTSNMYAYVDGVLDKTQGRTQSGTITWPTYQLIGTDDTLSDWFSGGVDEVCMIKGDALNITEIVDLYELGECGRTTTDIRTLDINVTIPNVAVSPLLDKFSVSTEYRWSGSGENVLVQAYDFFNDQWVNLTNELTYSLTDSIISSELTGNQTYYVDGSGNFKVRYHDAASVDNNVHRLSLDHVYVISHEHVDTPITEIRGGGEVHVNNITKYAQATWEYYDRQLTEFNFDITDEESVWNYFNRTLTEAVDLSNVSIDGVSDDVWNYPNRTLTYYEPTDLSSLANITATDVWTAPTRTLTSFGTLIADIWAYATRTLTVFGFDVVDEELISDHVWNNTGRYVHGELLS